MENCVNDTSPKEIFKFHYSGRKPKKLENNVFIIYSPERIKLQPGKRKLIDTRVKLYFSKNVNGSCRLLYSYQHQGLKLLNSKYISQEINANIDNFFTIDENNLPPWKLIFELYNTSLTETIVIRSKVELGYFLTQQHHTGKEIDFKFVKEKK